MLLHEAQELADNRLDEAGFSTAALAEIALPNTAYVDVDGSRAVAYAVHGQPDAPNVLLHSTPMFTRLDPHFKLRLAAQQVALGESYCVVGVEGYAPERGLFDHADRKELQNGSFRPLSARVLRVAEALRLADEQVALPYGYSLGADIAVQTAYDVKTNANRGVIKLDGLGVTEPARMVRRGLGVMKDFSASSKELEKNVTASGVPALFEAWGGAPGKIDSKAAKGVVKFIGSSLWSSIALLRGFGTDETARQIEELAERGDLTIMLGRQRESTVTPRDAVDRLLENHPNIQLVEDAGDHSIDDNIRRSAGRAVMFASLIDS